jgi:glutathione S-transferase
VQLALEYKRLAYESRLLQFAMQEHKSPQMLRMNPRGRVPVLKDGDYVVFESLACLLYLDRKYPEPPLFGRTPEEAGTIMRVICEYQAYAESHLMQIVHAVFFENMDERAEEVTRATHIVAGEARTLEGRLPATCARASCRWRARIRPSRAGSGASKACRATIAPIRLTGATVRREAERTQPRRPGRCVTRG